MKTTSNRVGELIVEPIDIYFVCWVDIKPIHLLSTFSSFLTMVNRKTKDKHGRFIVAAIEKPTGILVYNDAMGGTDLNDGQLQRIRPNIRSKKLPQKIIFNESISSTNNSHILWKYHIGAPKRFTLVQYTKDLVLELIEDWI